MEKKCKKAKWLSEYALQIAVKRREVKSKGEKERQYFNNKGLSSQSYGFSSSHVWIWELDYKESWAPKNCGVGEDSWESLGLQGDQSSQS